MPERIAIGKISLGKSSIHDCEMSCIPILAGVPNPSLQQWNVQRRKEIRTHELQECLLGFDGRAIGYLEACIQTTARWI